MSKTIDLGFANNAPRLLKNLTKLLQEGEEAEWNNFNNVDEINRDINDFCGICVYKVWVNCIDDNEDCDEQTCDHRYNFVFSIKSKNDFTIAKTTPYEKESLMAQDICEDIRDELIAQLNLFDNIRKIPMCGCECAVLKSGSLMCDSCDLLVSYYDDEVCPICIDVERKNEVWCATKCGHIFHKHCIVSVKDEKCPMCRAEMAGWMYKDL